MIFLPISRDDESTIAHLNASSHQILTLFGYSVSKSQFRAAYLFITFEWDVTTNHVEQKNAQRPNGGTFAFIAPLLYPFGRRVYTSSWNLKT